MEDRSKICDCYKWNLADIVENETVWEKNFKTLLPKTEKLASYKGKLGDDEVLLEFLKESNEHSLMLEKLFVWAKMHKDTDTTNSKYQALTERVQTVAVKMSSMLSFVNVELSAFSDEKLNGIIENKIFENYSVFFKEILRSKKLILSEKEEKILAEVGSFSSNSSLIFSMFDNADIKFENVEDENGNSVELSHGVYSLMLQNPNQEVRERAFGSMFSAYKDHKNTLAAIYAGNLKKDWFYAKIRGFEKSLDYSMYNENVKSVAYEKLIDAIGKGTKAMHHYISLRKDILGLETLNMFDLYVPLVSSAKLALEYEDSCKLVKEALLPLGDEYQNLLDRSFAERWIDVFETKGKRSGAYSWGAYGVHPYVLLNYQKTTHDVFTIAHELGHAMHSFYSNQNQCYEKAGYEIFVAEIASTVNEVLLLKHLLKKSSGEMRNYLLSYYLDMFRTTIFRQSMFAEFEVEAHSLVENDMPVTSENLNDIYLNLNKKYYGKAVKHNDLIAYEWSRIPHFYNSFYVYKYATGMTAAVSIANKILKEGESAVADYKKFLSAGGSMPPLDILRLAGIDLETDEPYEVAMKEFENTVDELEQVWKNEQ